MESTREVLIRLRLATDKANAQASRALGREVDGLRDTAVKAQEAISKAAQKAQREAQKAIRDANRELERQMGIVRESGAKMAESFKMAGAGAVQALRGAALAFASTEEDAEKMLKTIVGIQAGFDLLRGGIDVFMGLTRGVRAYTEGIEAAAAAQKALSVAQGAGAVTGVGSAAAGVGAAGAGVGGFGPILAGFTTAALAAAAALQTLEVAARAAAGKDPLGGKGVGMTSKFVRWFTRSGISGQGLADPEARAAALRGELGWFGTSSYYTAEAQAMRAESKTGRMEQVRRDAAEARSLGEANAKARQQLQMMEIQGKEKQLRLEEQIQQTALNGLNEQIRKVEAQVSIQKRAAEQLRSQNRSAQEKFAMATPEEQARLLELAQKARSGVGLTREEESLLSNYREVGSLDSAIVESRAARAQAAGYGSFAGNEFGQRIGIAEEAQRRLTLEIEQRRLEVTVVSNHRAAIQEALADVGRQIEKHDEQLKAEMRQAMQSMIDDNNVKRGNLLASTARM